MESCPESEMCLSKQLIFRAQASNTLNNEQTELEANIFLLQLDFFVFILDGEEANLVLRTLNYTYQYHLFFVFSIFMFDYLYIYLERRRYTITAASYLSIDSYLYLYYIICLLTLRIL